MSVLLSRTDRLEDVSVEVAGSFDGQGAPSYGSASTIKARAVREAEQVIGPDGSMIRTTLTLWVPTGESVTPAEGDRITYNSETFIVAEQTQPKTLRGSVTHTRLRCRDEGA